MKLFIVIVTRERVSQISRIMAVVVSSKNCNVAAAVTMPDSKSNGKLAVVLLHNDNAVARHDEKEAYGRSEVT